jgi:hypothetical protein
LAPIGIADGPTTGGATGVVAGVETTGVAARGVTIAGGVADEVTFAGTDAAATGVTTGGGAATGGAGSNVTGGAT